MLKRDDIRSNWEVFGTLYWSHLDVKRGFLPFSGLPNRLFAGCLQVKIRFGENCNVISNPKITRKHYPIPVCQMQLLTFRIFYM
jgi:hypothetical protein